MGIFETTVYHTYNQVDIHSLGAHFKDVFGEKYKVKVNEKHTGVKKIVTGKSMDVVLLTKNAYHRLNVSIADSGDQLTESGKKEFYINFIQAPSKGWMNFLRKEAGFVGGLILGLIFGKADEFHSEVIEAVDKKYDLHERKVGLGTVFKKK